MMRLMVTLSIVSFHGLISQSHQFGAQTRTGFIYGCSHRFWESATMGILDISGYGHINTSLARASSYVSQHLPSYLWRI